MSRKFMKECWFWQHTWLNCWVACIRPNISLSHLGVPKCFNVAHSIPYISSLFCLHITVVGLISKKMMNQHTGRIWNRSQTGAETAIDVISVFLWNEWVKSLKFLGVQIMKDLLSRGSPGASLFPADNEKYKPLPFHPHHFQHKSKRTHGKSMRTLGRHAKLHTDGDLNSNQGETRDPGAVR